MAILSDREIFSAIEKNIISIDPLIANNVQPASIDLTLHKTIDVLDFPNEIDFVSISMEVLKSCTHEVDISEGYTLEPGSFITGYSAEQIKLSSFFVGRIFNRNSLARCGLDASISAFMNPGFSGRKVIVINNFGKVPIKIRSGIRICQLEISALGEEALRSFEERHDIEMLKNISDRFMKVETKQLDTSLSEFLDTRIKQIALR